MEVIMMDEIKEVRKELRELKRLLCRTHAFVEYKLPDLPEFLDFEEILDWIKYLSGYLDCLAKFVAKEVVSE